MFVIIFRMESSAIILRWIVALACSVVSPRMGPSGWPFASVDPFPGADMDPNHNAEHVKDLYLRVDKSYAARCVYVLK